MIDPLRPYWPTNRSIAGLLVRSAAVLAASATVAAGVSRSLALLVVLGAAMAQVSLLVLEWMELRKMGRNGLVALAILGGLLFFLTLVLVIEGRSVLVLSVR